VHAGSIYKKTTPYFVVDLKQDQTDLTGVSDLGSVAEGNWFYDPTTGILYAHFTGSVDPITIQAIVSYRFFFSSGPCVASYDLTDTGAHVQYEGRIVSVPGYKHLVGIDQSLTAVVGSGTLKLENADGGMDEIFDTLFFENRLATLYSWNRDLDFSEAKVIYRGRVTNKRFGANDVSFLIKDTIFDLEQAIPLVAYDDTDTVNDNIKGRYKRWVYGRVDGLQIQSTDQIGEGYLITGTVSVIAGSNTLTGVGTSFLSEISPEDEITIGTQEFSITSIESDTSLTLSDEADFGVVAEPATLLPQIPVVTKNREFLVTGHACSNLTYDIVKYIQLNRIELSSTVGLERGDFIKFTNGERKEIKTVAPGNIVVLQSNIINQPALPSTVTRQPVQKLFKESDTINADNFTLSNLGAPTNECTITLDSDVEFELARATNLGFDLVFTNGLRSITTPDAVDLRESLSSRDWIRPANLAYTTYYEILSVSETSLELRVAFADPTITDPVTAKRPDYIGDNTIISCEVIGKTEDGEPDGEWIKTAAQAVRDVISEIDIPDSFVNETSFTDGEADARQIISLSLPLSSTGRTVTAKSTVDLLNQSVFGSLTLDNDLRLKYKILQTDTPANPPQVHDEQIFKWNIKTTNGKNFRDALTRYKHKDIDRTSLQSGASVQTFSSDFVRDYIGTSKIKEFDAYLFNESEACTYTERQVYYNRISRSEITLETDLRFEAVEIGDLMQLEMKRLYKRLGDSASNKKLAIVVGKTVTGQTIKLQLSDLGNLFNSSAVIAPDTTNDYSTSTEDEKLKYGFITDVQGIVDSDEDTANINLIS
jgi:hypothetical protein